MKFAPSMNIHGVSMGKNRSNKSKNKKQSVAKDKADKRPTGFDWGYPSYSMVAANPELLNRLRAGGFSGCGYGLLTEEGPPFISLVGKDLAAMKSALNLIREWVDIAGPSSVSLEILFDGPGYVLSISQDQDLLRWRLSGVDTTEDPIVLTMSLTKRIDTRHPFLNDLAKYARQPIAPVFLTVASLPSFAKDKSYDAKALETWMEGGIMLPGVGVYKTVAERPAISMVRAASETVEFGPPPKKEINAKSINANRERRLGARFAKTLHKLRNKIEYVSLAAELQAAGYSGWQIEQAFCNIEINGVISPEVKGTMRRQKVFEDLTRTYVEPMTIKDEVFVSNVQQVEDQILADTRYLLKKLDAKAQVNTTFCELNARLKDLGYV